MVDPVTTNRGFAQPTRGSDVGTWDLPMNGNTSLLDTILGGQGTVAAVDGGTVTLNAAQLAFGFIPITGAVSTTADIIFPAVAGWWSLYNITTGSGVLSILSTGSTESICIPQGQIVDIQVSGTTVRFRNLPPVGSFLDVCDATVPNWITGCTIPPYLNCNGTTFSGSTYPYLAAKLGSTTLPDLRGTARYALNQGTGRLTNAGSGLDGDTRFAIKTSQTNTLITVNLPPYTPSGTLTDSTSSTDTVLVNGNVVQNLAAGTNGFGWSNNPVVKTIKAALAWSASFAGNPQGGTSTPFGVVGPGTISGLMLIRAA